MGSKGKPTKRAGHGSGHGFDASSLRDAVAARRARSDSAPKVRPIDEKTFRIPTPGGEPILLTRRHFLYGAIGAGVLAAAGAGYSAYNAAQEQESDIGALEVPESAVKTLDDFDLVETEDAFYLAGDYELPYGSLLWASGDDIAACLLPTESASPIAQVALLNLASGAYSTVMDAAVGAAEGFEVYDVRATTAGLVWTEAQIMEGRWRIMAAPLSQYSPGQARIVDEGDASTETPTIAAVGDWAYWQVMPASSNENARHETSYVRRAAFASGEAEDVLSATGRMACPITAGTGCVVCAPHSDKAYSYFDLTCIDADSGQVSDRLTLPVSMTPNQLGYGKTGFAFCFESIYSYGDGIANLGTYAPMATEQAGDYSSRQWFRFGRTPYTAPSWCGDWFVVKSTQSVCAVSFDAGAYCAFDVESGCADWGDFLVSSGANDSVVCAMQIDNTDAEGEATKICQVRIWRLRE